MTTTTTTLDVRPVIAAGGDPFQLIMKKVAPLGPDDAVELIVGFEPRPLYAVLGGMGYATETRREGEAFHVRISRDPTAAPPPASERAELKAPVELDVRGMEPPQPLLAIFEKLAEIGPGAQLVVRHHREPRLLYEKLAARGYGARAVELPSGEWRVRIAPEWVFEKEGV